MINDVILEEIVADIWRHAVALLLCLAFYRYPDLPQKPLNELQDVTDFVTLQVPQSNLGTWMRVFFTQPGLQREPGGFCQGWPWN